MRERSKYFLDLVVFKHSIFSAAFAGVAIVATFLDPVTPTFKAAQILKLLFLCLICILSARNFAMCFNRIVDLKFDALNPRTKDRPSANKTLSKQQMQLFCGFNATLFIGSSFFINNLAFLLSPIFLVLLGSYSFFKRFSVSAHLMLGLNLALAPIACTVAFLETVPLWALTLSTGVCFWVCGFDILYSIQDLNFDKKHGLFSIPAKFGLKCSLFLSRACHILAVVFWSYFAWLIGGVFVILGVVLSALMLIYEQILVSKNLQNIPKAFFVTNGYLGFIFFCAMIVQLGEKKLNFMGNFGN